MPAYLFLPSPSPGSLIFTILCCFICSSSRLALAPTYPSSTVSFKTRWTKSGLLNVTDTLKFEPVVLWKGFGNTSSSDGIYLGVSAGFVCNNTCNRSLFAVVILTMSDQGDLAWENAFVVWSANRNRLVGENATRELMADGDLALKDSDGSLVWCTNTSHKGVVGMRISCTKIWNEDNNFDSETLSGLPARISYDELRSATQNFSTKLGGGGFGSVFAGILPSGTKIAVKCLEYRERGQGMKEFRAELQTIGGINHFNLVKLQGFCADKSRRLLVYEHLENESLDKWLFSKNAELTLDWNTRFKIALDSARGLAYLHGDCRECIIHLDIKPENILLDEKFNAKISDFGLSKLMSRDENQVMTRARGTPGYMAPELTKFSRVTEKADIYSFGITLLEIVSGRRNVDLSARSMSDIFLLDILPQKAKEGKLMDVVDEHLHKEYENIEKEVLRMIRVGMWCILEDSRMRPPMAVIVKALEGVMELEDPPLNFRSSIGPVTDDNSCTPSSSGMLQPTL